MPFKSDQQRKFMFAVHPRIAKRWVKHTPKGKKLPKKVGEAPHIDADIDVGGKSMGAVDLRIEMFPMSSAEKQRLMKAFSKTGFVGEYRGEFIHFKPDHSADVIDASAAKKLPALPRGWERFMVFTNESSTPMMREVFCFKEH